MAESIPILQLLGLLGDARGDDLRTGFCHQNIIFNANPDAAEGRWHKVMPGIEVKRLFVDPATRIITSLLRVAPGAVYPAHRHAGLEHLYVVDGDAIFDDHTLNTGDYEARTPQSVHSTVTTTEGCLLLVIHNQHDEYL